MTVDADAAINSAMLGKINGSFSLIYLHFNIKKLLRCYVNEETFLYFFLITVSRFRDLNFYQIKNIRTFHEMVRLLLVCVISDVLISKLLHSFCVLPASFPASAMAIEESTVLLIPGTVMESIAKQEPALLFNIIQILSQRLKNSMELIESLALKEIPERLASFLRHESAKNKTDKNAVVKLTISQRELAKIMGATPEALSRALRKMANEGILSTSGRKISILNHEALEQLAEGEYQL